MLVFFYAWMWIVFTLSIFVLAFALFDYLRHRSCVLKSPFKRAILRPHTSRLHVLFQHSPLLGSTALRVISAQAASPPFRRSYSSTSLSGIITSLFSTHASYPHKYSITAPNAH